MGTLEIGSVAAAPEMAPTERLDCCAFFSFAITVDGRGLALEIRAPADAEDLVVALFGTAS